MVMTKINEMKYEEIASHVTSALHCEGELMQISRTNMGPETCLLIKKDENLSLVFHLGEEIRMFPQEPICELTNKIYKQLEQQNSVKVDTTSIRCERAVPRLINTAANRDLLKDVPHREILDLSLIYSIPVLGSDDSLGMARITNQMAQAGGYTEEDLYNCSLQNLNPQIQPLCEVLSEIMGGGVEAGPSDAVKSGIPEIYVLSNKSRIHGAAGILEESLLKNLSEKLGSDLYILPSSIHEVLIVPVDKEEENQACTLLNMVQTVNGAEVAKEEQLSNSLYRYSPENGLTLEAAGDDL